MYTSCLNYGLSKKGHRANDFSTDGGFAEYAVNNINTMVHVPGDMTDEEATLIVTAGTAMHGLDVLGGIIAGEGVVVTGPGPIGLMGVGVAKALGAQPVILTGTRQRRLEMGRRLGADAVVNVTNEDAVAAVQQLAMLLVMLFTSKGAAGYTGAGFVALAATLPAAGVIPVGGLALLLGIDRFMAEIHAVTNLFSNIFATVIITKWMGELDEVRSELVLAGGGS
jgi:threonine dehydrogenase-like Zn-dependent dehydrogenase